MNALIWIIRLPALFQQATIEFLAGCVLQNKPALTRDMIQDNAVKAGGGITIFAKVVILQKAATDNIN